MRFETPPGRQLQVDFGARRIEIAGEPIKVFLFVATLPGSPARRRRVWGGLGHSRRLHVRAFRSERQEHWFEGLESAFRAFGGVPEEILFDNARALVIHHDPHTREVRFHDRLLAFAKHWSFRPRACAPYRARTKGKDERGVGYVKRNAIAGRRFASWAALEAHLERWVQEVADARVHGTTGEAPAVRFAREAAALRPLGGRAPFRTIRALVRRVQTDCCVEVDGNAYSVPLRGLLAASPSGIGSMACWPSMAADRRGRSGRARRRPGPHLPCRPRGRGARRAHRPPRAGPRSRPF